MHIFPESKNQILNQISRDSKFLDGLTACDFKGEEIMMTGLWNEKPTIIKILRRLGCPMCRYEAKALSNLKPEFDKLGVQLIAITFEKAELKEFLEGGFWAFDILIDTNKSIYEAAGLNKTSRTLSAFKACKKLNIKGNMKGDKLQLGGTFVVSNYGTELLYEFRQTRVAMFPSLRQIVDCVGGDSDYLDEDEPKECVCRVKTKDFKVRNIFMKFIQ